MQINIDLSGLNAVIAAVKDGSIKKTLLAMKKEIKDNIDAIRARDPAATSDIEVLLLYSGLHATLAYRVAHKLYLGGHTFSARAISQVAKFFTGIEIHPGATIGKGLVIDHGAGVVIGETTEIGDNCTLYQGVTLGGTGKDTDNARRNSYRSAVLGNILKHNGICRNLGVIADIYRP